MFLIVYTVAEWYALFCNAWCN